MSEVAPSLDGLYERLRAFRFEQPGGRAFAQSLAREEGWDELYAQRVVEEYRRFLWLAGSSTELCSPSPAVDRAWHLHLLDTRSYWLELCPQVLGRPLHHLPSRGELLDSKRFAAAYALTLDAYRRAFGEPPRDIWPPAHLRDTGQPVRFDARRHVAIPRAWLLGVAGVALLGPPMAPHALELIGRCLRLGDYVFLGLLAVVALLSVCIADDVRQRALGPAGGDRADIDAALDRYDLAYLNEAERGPIDVAVTELVCAGALAVDARRRGLIVGGPAPFGATPLQQLVLEAVEGNPGCHLAEQRPKERHVRALLEPALVAAGLVVAPAQRRWLVVGAVIGTLLPLALVVGQLLVGTNRGTTSGFCCVFLPMLVGASLAGWLSPLLCTRRGQAALARARAGLPLPSAKSAVGDDFASLVSVFGASVLTLSTSTLSELGNLLSPPPSATGSGCGCGG